MRIAIVGCGFVADYYIATLRDYPQLTVAGVMDSDADRATHFAKNLFEKSAQSFDTQGFE